MVGKLPPLIGGGPVPKPIDLALIRERLAAMTPDSWREIRDQLVEPLSAMTSQPIDVPGGAMLSGVR